MSDCKDCGRPDPAAKPPPIRVGVEGFEGTLFSDRPPAQAVPPINPLQLAGLPAFEMFAAERRVAPKDAVFDLQLVGDYARWHAEKGQWPLETPWGELKGTE